MMMQETSMVQRAQCWRINLQCGMLRCRIEMEIGTPSMMSPALRMLNEDESDLNEYLDDPTDPVLCVPEQDHDEYWNIMRGAYESRFGEPGSTVNFWQLSAHSERLTLGVKMHSTAAFLSIQMRMESY